MASVHGRKLVFITGGNAGIGFEVAKQLVKLGHRVVLGCRDAAKAQAAVEELQRCAAKNPSCGTSSALATASYVQLDLTSFASVRSGAEAFLEQHNTLDVLCCNAGIIATKYRRTSDGHESTLQANHLGHFLLVHLLLPALRRSTSAEHPDARLGANANPARIVIVASELHRLRPSPPGPVPPSPSFMFDLSPTGPYPPPMAMYGLSKLYNIWFAVQLSRLLPPDGSVVANAVTPGFVPATQLSRDQPWLARQAMWVLGPLLPFAVSLAEGGRRVAAVCVGPEAAEAHGRYFARGRVAEPSADAADAQRAETLWMLSLHATGIPPEAYGGLGSAAGAEAPAPAAP